MSQNYIIDTQVESHNVTTIPIKIHEIRKARYTNNTVRG